MTRRYVTVQEANHMLPVVRESFYLISQMQAHVHSAFDKLEAIDAAPETDHFDVLEEGLPEESYPIRAQLKALVSALSDELDALEDRGCIVKDLEEGIVGWYSYDDEYGEIFLSWQLGEGRVSHWHEVNTGRVERRPISDLQSQ
jgi:hypothetical protein